MPTAPEPGTVAAQLAEMRSDVGLLGKVLDVRTGTGRRFAHVRGARAQAERVLERKAAIEKARGPAGVHINLPLILKFERDQPALRYRKRISPRILVVDDNLMHGAASVYTLKKQFGEVHFASNGRQALEIMEHSAIDVVFMDALMPVLDGAETTDIIRYTEESIGSRDFRTLIIGLVTYDEAHNNDLMDDLFLAGMDRYMIKPLSTHLRALTQLLCVEGASVEGFRRKALENRWVSNRYDVEVVLKGTPEQRRARDDVMSVVDDQVRAEKEVLQHFAGDEKFNIEDLFARQRREDMARMQLNAARLRDRVKQLELELEAARDENRRLTENKHHDQLLLFERRVEALITERDQLADDNTQLRGQNARSTADLKNLLANGFANEKKVVAAERHAARLQHKMEHNERRMMAMEDRNAAQQWNNYYGNRDLRVSGFHPPPVAMDLTGSWYREMLAQLQTEVNKFSRDAASHLESLEHMSMRAQMTSATFDGLRSDVAAVVAPMPVAMDKLAEDFGGAVQRVVANILVREAQFWKLASHDDGTLPREIKAIVASLDSHMREHLVNSKEVQTDYRDFEVVDVPQTGADAPAFMTEEQSEISMSTALARLGPLLTADDFVPTHVRRESFVKVQRYVSDAEEKRYKELVAIAQELRREVGAAFETVPDPQKEVKLRPILSNVRAHSFEDIKECFYNICDHIGTIVQLAHDAKPESTERGAKPGEKLGRSSRKPGSREPPKAERNRKVTVPSGPNFSEGRGDRSFGSSRRDGPPAAGAKPVKPAKNRDKLAASSAAAASPKQTKRAARASKRALNPQRALKLAEEQNIKAAKAPVGRVQVLAKATAAAIEASILDADAVVMSLEANAMSVAALAELCHTTGSDIRSVNPTRALPDDDGAAIKGGAAVSVPVTAALLREARDEARQAERKRDERPSTSEESNDDVRVSDIIDDHLLRTTAAEAITAESDSDDSDSDSTAPPTAEAQSRQEAHAKRAAWSGDGIYLTHRVTEEDTLESLASLYSVPVADLVASNHAALGKADDATEDAATPALESDTVLRVPVDAETVRQTIVNRDEMSGSKSSTTISTSREIRAAAISAAALDAAVAAALEQQRTVTIVPHVVASGEGTASSIALKYGVSTASVVSMNAELFRSAGDTAEEGAVVNVPVRTAQVMRMLEDEKEVLHEKYAAAKAEAAVLQLVQREADAAEAREAIEAMKSTLVRHRSALRLLHGVTEQIADEVARVATPRAKQRPTPPPIVASTTAESAPSTPRGADPPADRAPRGDSPQQSPQGRDKAHRGSIAPSRSAVVKPVTERARPKELSAARTSSMRNPRDGGGTRRQSVKSVVSPTRAAKPAASSGFSKSMRDRRTAQGADASNDGADITSELSQHHAANGGVGGTTPSQSSQQSSRAPSVQSRLTPRDEAAMSRGSAPHSRGNSPPAAPPDRPRFYSTVGVTQSTDDVADASEDDEVRVIGPSVLTLLHGGDETGATARVAQRTPTSPGDGRDTRSAGEAETGDGAERTEATAEADEVAAAATDRSSTAHDESTRSQLRSPSADKEFTAPLGAAPATAQALEASEGTTHASHVQHDESGSTAPHARHDTLPPPRRGSAAATPSDASPIDAAVVQSTAGSPRGDDLTALSERHADSPTHVSATASVPTSPLVATEAHGLTTPRGVSRTSTPGNAAGGIEGSADAGEAAATRTDGGSAAAAAGEEEGADAQLTEAPDDERSEAPHGGEGVMPLDAVAATDGTTSHVDTPTAPPQPIVTPKTPGSATSGGADDSSTSTPVAQAPKPSSRHKTPRQSPGRKAAPRVPAPSPPAVPAPQERPSDRTATPTSPVAALPPANAAAAPTKQPPKKVPAASVPPRQSPAQGLPPVLEVLAKHVLKPTPLTTSPRASSPGRGAAAAPPVAAKQPQQLAKHKPGQLPPVFAATPPNAAKRPTAADTAMPTMVGTHVGPADAAGRALPIVPPVTEPRALSPMRARAFPGGTGRASPTASPPPRTRDETVEELQIFGAKRHLPPRASPEDRDPRRASPVAQPPGSSAFVAARLDPTLVPHPPAPPLPVTPFRDTRPSPPLLEQVGVPRRAPSPPPGKRPPSPLRRHPESAMKAPIAPIPERASPPKGRPTIPVKRVDYKQRFRVNPKTDSRRRGVAPAPPTTDAESLKAMLDQLQQLRDGS